MQVYCLFPQLVNNYILATRDTELLEASTRLLLDVVPGLETSFIFQETVRSFILQSLREMDQILINIEA